ncbi:hypothetical protein HZS_7508, partial [Henneguya salminicola]
TDYSDLEKFEHKNFCIQQIGLELQKIDKNEIPKTLNSAIQLIFPSRPKQLYHQIFQYMFWILTYFNCSTNQLVFTFFQNDNITKQSAGAWNRAINYITDHHAEFENKELRKLFYLMLEKAYNINNVDLEIASVMSKIIEGFKQNMDKIYANFHSLRFMITTYKRSLCVPLVGVTNLNESIWIVDYRSLLFKNPLLYCHYHSETSTSENAYVTNVFFHSFRLDLICTIFEMPKSSKNFSPNFCNCLIQVLEIISHDILNDIDTKTIIKDYINILVRPFSDFVCVASFKDMINLADLYQNIQKFIQSTPRPTLIKFIAVNLICESLPMCKMNLGMNALNELAEFISSLSEKQLFYRGARPDATFLAQVLFQTWLQIANKSKEELKYFDIKPPEGIAQLLTNYTETVMNSITAPFISDSAFYINVFSSKSVLMNKCYSKLMSFYFENAAKWMKLPRGLDVKIHENYHDNNSVFFSQLKCFPLTQLCLFIMGQISDRVEKDQKYIISPPLLEILHLITLGDLGFSIRFHHNVVLAFNKFTKLKAYYCINAMIEMLTYKSFPYDDLTYMCIILRSAGSLETLCLDHKELLLYSNTLIASVLIRVPKFNLSYVPSIFPQIGVDGLVYHYPDVNLLFIYHMCQACFFYGNHKRYTSQLLSYIRCALTELPHTWNRNLLNKFPQDIQLIYKSVTSDFIENEIDNYVREIKNHLRTSIIQDSTEFLKLTKQSKYQKVLLCVIFDSKMGESSLNDRVLFNFLKHIGSYNIIYSIRILLFYIIIIQKITPQSLKMNKSIEVLSDMIWLYNIFTADQLLLALLIFNYNDQGIDTIFCLIEHLFLHKNIANALSYASICFVNLKNLVSHINVNTEFYQKFPERFDYNILNKVAGIKDELKEPQYLPIYYGNLIFRLSFYVDLIICRCLDAPDFSFHLNRMLNICWKFIQYHPCPIRSLLHILIYYNEELSKYQQEKELLVTIYLTKKYDQLSIRKLFSDELASLFYSQIKPTINLVKLCEKNLIKLAAAGCYSRGKLLHNFGKTIEEFHNHHSYQLFICSAIEFLCFMDKIIFSNTIIATFLNSSSIVYNGAQCHINFEYFIQAFGLILSIMPREYVMECVQLMANTINLLHDDSDHSLMYTPSFLNIQNDTNPRDLPISAVILFLIRSYLYFTPLGYLLELPQLLATYFSQSITTEFQFLLLTASIIPCLQRISQEPDCFDIFEKITVQFSNLLFRINENVECFIYPALVSDFFFILKYKYLGDKVKDILEKLQINMKPELKIYFTEYRRDFCSATVAKTSMMSSLILISSTSARIAIILRISSIEYGLVGTIVNRSSKSRGIPCGDIIS